MISVERLSKNFSANINALTDLSFHLNQGEILGLLGENGAGKTTLFRLLASLIQPSNGKIFLNGIDVLKNPTLSRSHFGVLLGAELGLYERLTAKENILYFGRLHGIKKDILSSALDRFINELDMSDFIDRPVGKLSRGMKVRVAIARVLIHNPSILLLDEPTTGLDPVSIREVHSIITNLHDQGKTILLSSHNVPEVKRLCKQVLILSKGKSVASGNIESLESKFNGSLEEVFLLLAGNRK